MPVRCPACTQDHGTPCAYAGPYVMSAETGIAEEIGSPPSSIAWAPLGTMSMPLRTTASPPGGSPPGSLPQSPYRNFIKPSAFLSPPTSTTVR